MVKAGTLSEHDVIQLLKMQIVKFENLPPMVRTAVEEHFKKKSKLDAIEDDIEMLEGKIRLQAIEKKLNAKDKWSHGRWITTEKNMRVFIPDGADVKETVDKWIKNRRSKSTKEDRMKKYSGKKPKWSGFKKDLDNRIALENKKREKEGKRPLRNAEVMERYNELHNDYVEMIGPEGKNKSKDQLISEAKRTLLNDKRYADTPERREKIIDAVFRQNGQDWRKMGIKKEIESLIHNTPLKKEKIRNLRKEMTETQEERIERIFQKASDRNMQKHYDDLVDGLKKLYDEDVAGKHNTKEFLSLVRHHLEGSGISDDSKEKIMERAKEVIEPKYRGPENPKWSDFGQYVKREREFEEKKREKEGKPKMNEREETLFYKDLFDMYADKIKERKDKEK